MMRATGACAVKVVNPGGISAFKFNVRGLEIDEPGPEHGVTPRTIIRTLTRAVHELGVPHPLHVHCNNLGIPGNVETTLATIDAAEGHPIHLTHVQFHSYGTEGKRHFSSAASRIAEAVNRNQNVSIDVGQIIFGPTITASGDTQAQFRNRRFAKPDKWISMDIECDGGCGLVPFRYRDTNFVNALQWAIGLELFLLVEDPWRVFLTTDHPNGGPFTSYPQLVRLLMERSFREDCLAQIHQAARKLSALGGTDARIQPARDRDHDPRRSGPQPRPRRSRPFGGGRRGRHRGLSHQHRYRGDVRRARSCLQGGRRSGAARQDPGDAARRDPDRAPGLRQADREAGAALLRRPHDDRLRPFPAARQRSRRCRRRPGGAPLPRRGRPAVIIEGVEIEDTFAEAFPMAATRLVITADSARWARIAAETATGFATSVIACGVEAGIEGELAPEATPDGRPGIAILLFAFNREALVKAARDRVGQCVLTCPGTACYGGIEQGEALPLGRALALFRRRLRGGKASRRPALLAHSGHGRRVPVRGYGPPESGDRRR